MKFSIKHIVFIYSVYNFMKLSFGEDVGEVREGGHEYGVQLGVNNSCSHECKVFIICFVARILLT